MADKKMCRWFWQHRWTKWKHAMRKVRYIWWDDGWSDQVYQFRECEVCGKYQEEDI